MIHFDYDTCEDCMSILSHSPPQPEEGRMSNVPSEKQLESTFEVLAWLERRIPRGDAGLRYKWAVEDVRDRIKEEVDRCLDE